MIFFDKDLQSAALVAEELDNSIRPVTVPVTLSNSMPQHYTREIPSIKNGDLSKGFEDYSFTSFDITNYLASRMWRTAPARMPFTPAGLTNGNSASDHDDE